jgi:trans-aconitate 2-methyltransferase
MHPSALEVQSYYDSFLKHRMLDYRISGNLRIEKAKKFFVSHLRDDDVIVDVGCGIGLATEAMAKAASKGIVLGLDISQQNIWYANKTISRPNLSFRSIDITKDADAVVSYLTKKPTVIVMCDCIEHIPEGERKAMLAKFVEIGADNLKILLTFPSEYCIDFLRRENPGEIQIIDNSISASMLADEARDAGLSIVQFNLVDVWRRFEYVHCVLQRTDYLVESVKQTVSLPREFRVPGIKRIVHRFRRWKYIDRLFVESNEVQSRTTRDHQ